MTLWDLLSLSSPHSPSSPSSPFSLPSPSTHAAERLGLWSPGSLSLSGEELESLPPHQLADSIIQTSVFYRVTPKHKVIIVKVRRPS